MSSKVTLLIDVGNQFFCINKRWPGRKLNYSEYLEKAKTFGTVTRAIAYGTQIDDSAATFITALHHLGFEPKFKQIEKNTWYAWDVGISVDVVRFHEKTDVLVLGSSNRNMVPIIKWAKERGIRVVVMSCGVNRDLKDAADQWLEITESMLEEAADELAEATE